MHQHPRPFRVLARLFVLAVAIVLASTTAAANDLAQTIENEAFLYEELAKAEAEHGETSEQYLKVLAHIVSFHSGVGDLDKSLAQFDRLLSLWQVAMPDDANLPGLRQVRDSLALLERSCTVGEAQPEARGTGGFGFELVPQTQDVGALSHHAMSADGRYLVVTGNTELVVREMEYGRIVRRIRTGTGQILDVDLSPDGRQVVAASANGCVSIWDAGTGDKLQAFPAPMGSQFSDLALSPDGRRLGISYTVPATQDARFVLWAMDGDEPRRVILSDTSRFTVVDEQVVFDPSSARVGTYSFLGIQLWDADTGLPVGAPDPGELLKTAGREGELLYGLAYSPDGRLMAIATNDGLSLVDRETGRAVQDLPKASIGRDTLKFSRDGQWLVHGEDHLWAVADGRSLAMPESLVASWSDWTQAGELLSVGPFGNAVRWHPETGDAHYVRGVEISLVQYADFAADGRELWINGGQTRWDLAQFRPQHVSYEQWRASLWEDGYAPWSGGTNPVMARRLTSEGAVVLVGDGESRVGTWQMPDGAAGRIYRGPDDPITAVALAADAPVLAAADGKSMLDFSNEPGPRPVIFVWDEGEPDPRLQLGGHEGRVAALALSGDGEWLASAANNGIRIWELNEGKVLHRLLSDHDFVTALAFSPDRKYLLVSVFATPERFQPEVLMLEVASGEVVARFDVPGAVEQIEVSEALPLAAITLSSGSVYLWNLESQHQVVLGQQFQGTDEMGLMPRLEWIAYTSDGYFTAGRGGTRLVAAVRNQKAYELDQFALPFNRPDVILERMGLGTPDMIEHYRLRHELRLRKARLSETGDLHDLVLPEVRITESRVEDGEGEVRIEASTTTGTLRDYTLFVNGVPVPGADGVALTGREDTARATFALSSGRNLVEVSVRDASGLESTRDAVVIEHGERAAGSLYFLGFGVSRYQDASLNLGYAHKDALDLARFFEELGAFDAVHVRTYTDSEVTVGSVGEARTFVSQAGIDDTVIVFIAGHGMHARTGLATYYYLTHEAQLDRLEETAAPFEQLEALLDGIPSRRKLFLMDTCESGELEPGSLAAADLETGEQAGRRARGFKRDVATVPAASTPAVRSYLHDRGRYIYNDLSRRTGAVVFSSSSGGELSYESSEIENGYFTEALLRVLSTPGVERFATVREQVERSVALETLQRQHPTVDRDNVHADLRFR